jgi:hypothetical protein
MKGIAMPFCAKCRLTVATPCFSASADQTKECVVVATDPELLRWCNFQRTAMATKGLGLSRRDIANWITQALSSDGVRFVTAVGVPFEISDTAIDDAFRNDGSFRWLSDFTGFADRPPMQTPQQRILDRLRLIDLAFRVLLARDASANLPPKRIPPGDKL